MSEDEFYRKMAESILRRALQEIHDLGFWVTDTFDIAKLEKEDK